nr:ATP-dependent Clp protease adaptor ClpS [Moraxella sp. CTOTU48268]
MMLQTLNFSRQSVVSQPTTTNMDWHLPAWLPTQSPKQLPNQSPNSLPARLTDIEGEPNTDPVEDVLLADPELKKPQMYAVVMYNDDYTPMEFVVDVLQNHFKHSLDSAISIMLAIHHQGKGIAGIYPKDIAETKAQTVNREARQAGYPLLSQIEPQG